MEMSELRNSDISFIVEDNLLKVGNSCGTGVPILDVAELLKNNIVVFA